MPSCGLMLKGYLFLYFSFHLYTSHSSQRLRCFVVLRISEIDLCEIPANLFDKKEAYALCVALDRVCSHYSHARLTCGASSEVRSLPDSLHVNQLFYVHLILRLYGDSYNFIFFTFLPCNRLLCICVKS